MREWRTLKKRRNLNRRCVDLKTKKVTISDIRESLYDANLDTEYREALAHALMALEYVNDSPLHLHFGTHEQKEEIRRVEAMALNSNQISEIIHLMMYEMRNDFQYGRFKPVADYYVNISKEIDNIEVDNSKREYEKPICNVETYATMYELICSASKTLKQNNMNNESREMIEKATLSYSYDDAFSIIEEYVELSKELENEEELE